MNIHPDIERVAALGWHVYPASAKSKAACIKNPTWRATTDLDQIAQWSREFPRCNWRVVFGPSRLWGLDCDVPPGHAHDGVANLAALVKVHGELPRRPTARSGGGGLGLFFRHNGERIIGEGGHPAPGIDPRRGGLSQTIPPSIHIRTRAPYRWLIPPWECEPPTAPAWLLRLVEPPPEPLHRPPPIDTTDAARKRLYRACGDIAHAGDGTRNQTLNRKAYAMGILIGAGRIGQQEVVEQLFHAAMSAGCDRAEVTGTIKSGILSGMRSAGGA
jgi:hypothetical protein